MQEGSIKGDSGDREEGKVECIKLPPFYIWLPYQMCVCATAARINFNLSHGKREGERGQNDFICIFLWKKYENILSRLFFMKKC